MLEVLYQNFFNQNFSVYCDENGGKEVVTATNSSQLSIDIDDESIQFVIVSGSTLLCIFIFLSQR